MKTQRQEILDYIRNHGSITRAKAANLHIYELSSRIGELEKEGWTFTRKTIKGTNAYGRRWRCTEYSRPVKKERGIHNDKAWREHWDNAEKKETHPWRQNWR